MLRPSDCSRAATAELSTPPDIATAIIPVSGTRRVSGRETPQMRGGFGHGFDQLVHLIERVLAAKRKADRRTRILTAHAHGQQHMRRLRGAAGARRPARYREALQVQRNHHGLALDALEADAGGVVNALRAGAIHPGVRYAAGDALLQQVAQLADALALIV